MPFFFKRVAFCRFATVLLQATFLPTIFVVQNLASATLSRAFSCVGEQTCNLTVSVLFFLCAGGSPSVLVQALRCFSQRHCRLAGWATACFPSKVCRHSVFFSFAVFSDEKMCCNRFLLMRFCTTLFALFHVRKQFNVAFCKR